jgi:ATP-dependent Clp protease ATP-binding subunit ClpC
LLKSKKTKRLQNLEMMRNASKELAIAKNNGKKMRKTIEVTEDNVADVVSMMTGIPVNRIAQTESNKLAILPELIE